MFTGLKPKYKGLCVITTNSLILKNFLLNSNFFMKSFYFSKKIIYRKAPFLYQLPLCLNSQIYSIFRIMRLWICSFSYFAIIGFELWGLGLNYFLLNKRTKLGKKYKEKRKKKKRTKMSIFRIILKRKFKHFKKCYQMRQQKRNLIFERKQISFLFKLKQNNYKFNKTRLLRKFSFKLGFSHRVGLFEPFHFRIVSQKKLSDFRRKRFFFVSTNSTLLKQYSLIIRYLKGINLYKFRGMKFMKEDLELKIGKIGRL